MDHDLRCRSTGRLGCAPPGDCITEYSEIEAKGELHHSWICRERGDGCHAAAAGVSTRLAEDRMVGEVEDLPANFRVHTLGEGKFLEECEVEELGLWADKRISAYVADGVVAGVGIGRSAASAKCSAGAVGAVVKPAGLFSRV